MARCSICNEEHESSPESKGDAKLLAMILAMQNATAESAKEVGAFDTQLGEDIFSMLYQCKTLLSWSVLYPMSARLLLHECKRLAVTDDKSDGAEALELLWQKMNAVDAEW